MPSLHSADICLGFYEVWGVSPLPQCSICISIMGFSLPTDVSSSFCWCHSLIHNALGVSLSCGIRWFFHSHSTWAAALSLCFFEGIQLWLLSHYQPRINLSFLQMLSALPNTVTSPFTYLSLLLKPWVWMRKGWNNGEENRRPMGAFCLMIC